MSGRLLEKIKFVRFLLLASRSLGWWARYQSTSLRWAWCRADVASGVRAVAQLRDSVDKFSKLIDSPCATAKSAKSKAFTQTEGENNHGAGKENRTQDETHRP